MLATLDLSSFLAFAPHRTPLRIWQIADQLRMYCAQRGLREGDRVTRSDVGEPHVLLSRADGRRIVIGVDEAMGIAVEPAIVS